MTTRAIVTGRGGPEVLDLVRVETPTPRPREVRIAVAAAGVAFGDVMRRRGVLAARRPFTPGYDVTGVVEEVGRDIDRALIGRRVAAMMPKPGIGGYAQICTARLARSMRDSQRAHERPRAWRWRDSRRSAAG